MLHGTKRVIVLTTAAIVLGIIVILSIHSLWYIHEYHIGMLKNQVLFNTVSPNQSFVLVAYDTSGGATSPFSVGAEVQSIQGDYKKAIFRAQFEENIEAYWIDDYTVCINSIVLDVRYDTFDNTRLSYKEQRYDKYNMKAIRRKVPSNFIEKFIENLLYY
ncbi:MAG: hypothetical protein IKR85_11880 [Clostridia bacterium]|nr:hypothetical protein [Clostridia bacterium]